MLERFTDQARQAVVEAKNAARSLQHDSVGTEHLLLGLLADPVDLAARVLIRHHVTPVNAREHVQDIVVAGHDAAGGAIEFTLRAKTVLGIALREARHLRHDHIDTGHLLLALLHEGRGVGFQVITRLGAFPAVVETDLLLQLTGSPTGNPTGLDEQLRTAQRADPHQPSADLAARLDNINDRLTDIATRLTNIEQRLTDG